jgi:hypothetical protein
MFEMNELNISVENFQDSKIYIADNCLKHPEKVVEYLNTTKTLLWKIEQDGSLNGLFFDDRRHIINEGTNSFINSIKNICSAKQIDNSVYSNYTLFYEDPFNDYKSNFWWPHTDDGYTALIYLNQYEGAGTNLYEQISPDIENVSEHSRPWREKHKYKVIKTIQSKFNRLVIFDGKKFKHGMAVENDIFFHERRMNIAVFMRD